MVAVCLLLKYLVAMSSWREYCLNAYKVTFWQCPVMVSALTVGVEVCGHGIGLVKWSCLVSTLTGARSSSSTRSTRPVSGR